MRSAVLILMSVLCLAPVEAGAARPKVAPLELARVLLLDGHPRRALSVLGEVDEAEEGLDKAELHRLRGLAESELGLHLQAVEDFRRALALGATGATLHYALANALLSTGDAPGALKALRNGGASVWTLVGAHRVQALALYRTGDKPAAFAAADEGARRFPKESTLARVRVQVLLELGLCEDGVPAMRAYLARPDVKADAAQYLEFAQAMAEAGATERAIVLLEEIVLRFPEAMEARERLARTYAARGRELSAAEVLRPYATDDARAALLAADYYAKAGKIEEALRTNTWVADPAKKLRQRLSILIEAERYAEAAALDAALGRVGLLSDEKLRYAVAYAQYVVGNDRRVTTLLGGVAEPGLFTKATALRRALEVCAADVWRCD